MEFAVKAQSGKFRKGTNLPYIIHPLGVAKILIEQECSEEIVIAGILHDTIEDTEITLEDIRKIFGDEVARIVHGASEPDKDGPWENRKRHTIEFLKTAPWDIFLVSLADKIDNIRAIREDYDKLGESLWSRFNRPKEKQRWYYQSLVEVFSRRIDEFPVRQLVEQFALDVQKVFWFFKVGKFPSDLTAPLEFLKELRRIRELTSGSDTPRHR